MIGRLLLLFILIPLVELALLVRLAEWISFRYTLLLVVATGVTGAMLARHQGWRTWSRIQRSLDAGQLPGSALLDGVMIFLAGALLITPGLITDAVGFSLLLPFCRRFYRRQLRKYFQLRITTYHQQRAGYADGQHDQVIDSYVVESRATESR